MDHEDEDAPEIDKALKRLGCSVFPLGRPLDRLVGFRGVTMLVEYKQPPGPQGGTSAKGQHLNETQVEFIQEWKGAKPLVVTIENCEARVLAEVERQLKGESKDGPTEESAERAMPGVGNGVALYGPDAG